MIFGNPRKFALYIDAVEEWCKVSNDLEGLSGIWIEDDLFITNTGLISLINDFENIIEKIPLLTDCPRLYELSNVELLKELLKSRFPNWYANSNADWEANIDEWHDIKEIFDYDISLESFNMGNELNYYLFCVKNCNKVKLLLYYKNKESDFFNFQRIVDRDIKCVEIPYEKIQYIINQIESYIIENT